MTPVTQSRNNSVEQALKEGYRLMADLNLSLATEAFQTECEACDTNETYLTSYYGE